MRRAWRGPREVTGEGGAARSARMTAAELAWTAGVLAAAAFSAARLLRAPARGQQGTRDGYRWLAAAAACAGSGAAVQRWFAGVVGGAEPLRVADLIALAALPAGGRRRGRQLPVHGLAVRDLPRERARAGRGGRGRQPGGAGRHPDPPRSRPDRVRAAASLRGARARAGCVHAQRLPGRAGPDRRLAARRPRAGPPHRGPGAAGRRPGRHPAVVPARLGGPGGPAGPDGPGWPAGAGACVVRPGRAGRADRGRVRRRDGHGRRGGRRPRGIAGAGMVILLVIRLALAARQASVVAAGAMESDRAFRLLADSAIDAVLVCDLGGVVGYASPAVADFGYSPGALAGARLADLVHPEDLPAGIRAVARVLRERRAAGPRPERHGPGGAGDPGGAARHGTAVPFAGRVRGADGSWHHIEASLSLCAGPGEPARMLVTARDVSDRVELRRQVTRLTFQDGLTGLPNRAYLEARVREPRPVALTRVDLDGYAGVNELVGRPGGDLILAQVGRLVRAAAPPDATAGRWGGDEFAIVTADAAPDAEPAGQQLGQAGQLGDPSERARHMLAAAHAAMIRARQAGGGDPSERARHLLAAAHAAMIRARQAGGGRAEIFAEGMPSVPARPSG